MSCYKIINNLPILEEFIESLPESGVNDRFYMSLFARKKYQISNTLTQSQCQLVRTACKKERIISHIRRMECSTNGSYCFKGVNVSQECLALYINPNPRDMIKATQTLAKKIIDLVCSKNEGYNIHQIALDKIQTAKSKTYWIDFDIDYDDEKAKDFDYRDLDNIVDAGSYKVLVTRGGCHVLVDPSKVIKFRKTFYQSLAAYADNTGDCLMPTPGCCQGGFTPYFQL